MNQQEFHEYEQTLVFIIDNSLLDAHRKANLKAIVYNAIQCWSSRPEAYHILEARLQKVMDEIITR